MANNRKNIRAKIKELLVADSEFTAIQIFSSRSTLAVQDEELPSITIFTPEEPVTPESLNRARYIRKLELRFEVRVDASESADDDLDDLLAKLETFMLNNSNLQGLLLDSVQQNTESDVGSEGNSEIGLGTLIFQCTYVS